MSNATLELNRNLLNGSRFIIGIGPIILVSFLNIRESVQSVLVLVPKIKLGTGTENLVWLKKRSYLKVLVLIFYWFLYNKMSQLNVSINLNQKPREHFPSIWNSIFKLKFIIWNLNLLSLHSFNKWTNETYMNVVCYLQLVVVSYKAILYIYGLWNESHYVVIDFLNNK